MTGLVVAAAIVLISVSRPNPALQPVRLDRAPPPPPENVAALELDSAAKDRQLVAWAR